MVIAELEVFHTRKIAPVRRIALGESNLPSDDSTSPGALLIAGVIGALAMSIPGEYHDELDDLLVDVGAGRPAAQPLLRYRFQIDTIGLERSTHRLHDKGDRLVLELDDRSFEHPMPQVLGAAYAVMRLPLLTRLDAVHLARHALRRGDDNIDVLVDWLTSDTAWRQDGTEVRWALRVLGFSGTSIPKPAVVAKQFRSLVRAAHPDSNGMKANAAEEISRLQDARHVLADHYQRSLIQSIQV
jgi:hypothetical protein